MDAHPPGYYPDWKTPLLFLKSGLRKEADQPWSASLHIYGFTALFSLPYPAEIPLGAAADSPILIFT